jgi:acetyl esterase/lipase
VRTDAGGVKTLAVTVCTLAMLLSACGAEPPDGASVELIVTRDVAVADVTTADVFAPRDAEGLPVVVMFHGTEGLRSNMEPLATEVARTGAVVVVPSWPVLTERPAFESTDDVFFPQTAAAVCGVRFARVTAGEFGGDPADITVVGHSGGAPVGARVALVDEPPWPGIDCYPGVSSHVDRFVGTGGDYTNEYQGGTWIPDVHRPYDVFQLEATNLDLEVRLVHGGADTSVNVGSSTVFDQHLDALGVDSELVYVDSTHRELRDPTTPGGRLVVEQIDALIHGRPSVFDGGGTDASLVFEGDRCRAEGSTTARIGRPLHVRLVDDSDVPVWFALVGFDPEHSDAEIAAILTAEPRPLDDVVAYTDPASFVRLEPDSDGDMTWVFVDDSLRWTSWCMPEADSPHPEAGAMFAASEVVVAP